MHHLSFQSWVPSTDVPKEIALTELAATAKVWNIKIAENCICTGIGENGDTIEGTAKD